MLKKTHASALVDRLRALRPSKQTMLSSLKRSLIVPIALVGVYVIFPLLRDGIPLSPQQRVEPLNRRIHDLDKQIKASPNPSTTDLKEIATLEKGRIDSENTIRTSLFQAVGGLLVFVTLYISWRTLQANEAKQAAERFSKAVEQLGNENIHVRLGGIYALEQIAKDAEEKYYWQVMETLTSYVRERSPWPPKTTKTHSSFVHAALETTNKPQRDEAIPPLPIDIQAVMTVLARRRHLYQDEFEPYRLDLRSTDLRRLHFPFEANLSGMNFDGANLERAVLHKADLRHAILAEANLKNASLAESDLYKANLNEARLQGAVLFKTRLQLVDLKGADLEGAKLKWTDLQHAELIKANLRQTQLDGANLQGADFRGADLYQSSLIQADLHSVSFAGANLQQVEFDNLMFKLLPSGKSFKATGLTWEQLDGAASYEGAILPDYLPPRQQPQTEKVQSTK